MNEKYIALAIPFFFVAIALELIVTRRSADPRYRFADSITNLSCGVGQQVLLPFFNVIVVGGYVLVYEKAALFHIASSSIPAMASMSSSEMYAEGWMRIVPGDERVGAIRTRCTRSR